MQITEIYKSVQGESTYAGLPWRFRAPDRVPICVACGATPSTAFYGGKRISPEQVFEQIVDLSPKGGLVEITGGETHAAGARTGSPDACLVTSGYKVLLETSGERALDRVPPDVIRSWT
jgi:7-carboxy-7-deazaguanine synthase